MEVLQPSWRGRLLNTRKGSDGKKYMAMCGAKSLLYTPVNVLPDATYRITLELHRESGNGVAYCNIYGNRNFDFPHIKVACEGSTWNTYDIDVSTKEFPNTVPMTFRLWRSPDGTGTLLVRRIKVELLKGEKIEEPVLVAQEIGPTPKSTKIFDPRYAIETHKRIQEERAATLEARRKNRNRRGNRVVSSSGDNTGRIHGIPMPSTPKISEKIIEQDGIKVSVIISLYNRRSFFERTLHTYSQQTMPKENFEIIVMDDCSTEDIEGLCESYSKKHNIRFRYVSFDRNAGAIRAKTFTPALSNNIGLKLARGSVIVISGPETLQGAKNLELSYQKASEGYCLYGNIYRSSQEFVDTLKTKWHNLSFDEIKEIPGALDNPAPLKGWWWYYIAIQKEHMLNIHGVDERFMLGIAGEDDDLANRIMRWGVPLTRHPEVVGLHQEHSHEDSMDALHSWRFDRRKWHSLRQHNIKLLREWFTDKNPVANRDIDWGCFDAIIKERIIE